MRYSLISQLSHFAVESAKGLQVDEAVVSGKANEPMAKRTVSENGERVDV
jgi:hypothetical protein